MSTLAERYDGFVCDLDGVVYRGPAAVEHAVVSLTALERVVYATNNASRPPQVVADHLSTLGLVTTAGDVVTSSEAGAAYLLENLGAAAEVLAVGGEGVALALEAAGLYVVAPQGAATPAVAGVLQGYGAAVTADDLAVTAYAVQAGAVWVATNTDATLPTDRGTAPGNGMLVAAVARASGTAPVVVGKPQAPLYDLACDRLGSRNVLGIGDRLDTDVLGAIAAGLDSLWVLTGVDDLESLARSPERATPTWVVPDLRGLHEPLPSVDEVGGWWSCGDVRLRAGSGAEAGTLEVAESDGVMTSAGGRGRRTALLNAGARLICSVRDRTGSSEDEALLLARAVAREAGEPAGRGGGQ